MNRHGLNFLVCLTATTLFSSGATAEAGDVALASSNLSSDPFARMLEAKIGTLAKIGTALAEAHHRYQAGEQRYQNQTLQRVDAAAPQPSTLGPSDALIRVVDGLVAIEAVAKEDVEDLLADLRALGCKGLSSYGRMVSAKVPVAALAELAGLTSLQLARPTMAMANAGLVISEGDEAINADLAREQDGLTGRRVTVGVLSNSFDCLGGAPADIASGDLPKRPVVLDDSACPGNDEGRAMMQIIRDIAPRARQAFHTAANGQADFAKGIMELAKRGRADVIVDDAIYLAEPMFQDGIIAEAVDAVSEKGVVYFSSAGNLGRNSWEGGFASSGIPGILGGTRHDFNPGAGVDDLQTVRLGTGTTTFVFQWDEPFFSVSGAPGSASDMDMFLYLPGGLFIGLGGAEGNIGGDPVEIFGVVNAGPPIDVEVGLELFAGPAPALMKYVIFAPGRAIASDPPDSFVVEFPTDSSSSYGHANAAGAVSVGAAFWRETPRFGVLPPEVQPFSSAGGTPVLFDTDGNRREVPELRQKPNVVGPDGGVTTFFGARDSIGERDSEGTNFFGTSASAPHVAGVAALMLQANRRLRPVDIRNLLETTAVDMDDPATPDVDPGFDFATGHGLVDALEAIGQARAFRPGDRGQRQRLALLRSDAELVQEFATDAMVGVPARAVPALDVGVSGHP